MPKVVSRMDFIRSASKPKRRYQVLALSSSGSVTLRAASRAPCYWFERHEEVIDGQGRFTIDPDQATVTLMVDGVASVLFYLVGRRLDACTFAFDLTPDQLVNAAAAMRCANLSSLVAKAASQALENLPPGRRAVLEDSLRALARRRRPKDREPE